MASCQLMNSKKNSHLHAFPPLNELYCMRLRQSDMKTLADLSSRRSNFYRHTGKQRHDGDKNNPRISSPTVTNFQLTLACDKENFPVLSNLLGPVEPEIPFFLFTPVFFQSNQHGAERLLATAKCGHEFAFCCV